MIRLYAKMEFTSRGIKRVSKNGSNQNGTVREAKMLAAMKKRLYLCTR